MVVLKADWGTGRGFTRAHEVLGHNHWKWKVHSTFMRHLVIECRPCARPWEPVLKRQSPCAWELSASRKDKHQTSRCSMNYSVRKARKNCRGGLGISGWSDFRWGWGRRHRETLFTFWCQEWLAINGVCVGGVLSGGAVEEKIFQAKGTACWRLNQTLLFLSFSFSISLCTYGLFSLHLKTKTKYFPR